MRAFILILTMVACGFCSDCVEISWFQSVLEVLERIVTAAQK